MLIRVNRQFLFGRETQCVRQNDGTFIRENCATLGAIENNADAFIRQFWQEKTADFAQWIAQNENNGKKCRRRPPRPTRVPLRLRARSSRTEMEKCSRVVLPSAARWRSLRSGSVPAVSPPALHFSARRTADRSFEIKSSKSRSVITHVIGTPVVPAPYYHNTNLTALPPTEWTSSAWSAIPTPDGIISGSGTNPPPIIAYYPGISTNIAHTANYP
jgi:hypothetical protein